MTDVSLAALDGQGQRRFDLVRIAAPVMTAACLAMAVVSQTPAMQMKFSGLVLMMAAMSVYVFTLRGKPITDRPPVVFAPGVLGLIATFLVGTILCGLGKGGLFGTAIMVLPSAFAFGSALFLNTKQGRAYRTALANRDC